jgi:3'(2'), 5'-bisphosphate nucleotidase
VIRPANFDILRLLAIAREAGAAIMSVYEGDIAVDKKADSSPLTLADLRSHQVITQRLKEWYPEVPVLSEETTEHAGYSVRRDWRECWLVDPLDGTKEFIKRNGQFTVNIALIQESRPVAGVVYAPARNVAYYGVAGQGAYKVSGEEAPQSLVRRERPDADTLMVVASLSHHSPEVDAFVAEKRQNYKNVELLNIGSSLKICMVAENSADVYPRLGPTMEWDTAAAHAVAAAAGRRVRNYRTGDELSYNKENLLNDWFIVE